MYEKECGMLVKDLRAEQGLSKKELSALLLIPLPVLSDIEAGNRLPDQTDALLLGNFFYVYPDKLLEGKRERKMDQNELLASIERLSRQMDDLSKTIKAVYAQTEPPIVAPKI